MCADESSFKYFRVINEGSNKWLIWLLGGSACTSKQSCDELKQLRPDAFKAPESFKGEMLLSQDQSISPFHDYNMVVLPYCTQDYWYGNHRNKEADLYFHGSVNFQNTILDLFYSPETQHFRRAETVIFGGPSAGGIGVLLHQKFLYHFVQTMNDGSSNWFNSTAGKFTEKDVPAVESTVDFAMIVESSFWTNYNGFWNRNWKDQFWRSFEPFDCVRADNANSTGRWYLPGAPMDGTPCCVSWECNFLGTETLRAENKPPVLFIDSLYDWMNIGGAYGSALNFNQRGILPTELESFANDKMRAMDAFLLKHPRASRFSTGGMKHTWMPTEAQLKCEEIPFLEMTITDKTLALECIADEDGKGYSLEFLYDESFKVTLKSGYNSYQKIKPKIQRFHEESLKPNGQSFSYVQTCKGPCLWSQDRVEREVSEIIYYVGLSDEQKLIDELLTKNYNNLSKDGLTEIVEDATADGEGLDDEKLEAIIVKIVKDQMFEDDAVFRVNEHAGMAFLCIVIMIAMIGIFVCALGTLDVWIMIRRPQFKAHEEVVSRRSMGLIKPDKNTPEILSRIHRIYSSQANVHEIEMETGRGQFKLEFEDLAWSPNRWDSREPLFRPSTGRLRSGRLTAVLGPPESGKTLLLDLLGGRVESGTYSGKIIVNGQDISEDLQQLQKYSCFVGQDEMPALNELTVFQNLMFHSMLLYPMKDFESLETEICIEADNVRLRKCLNTLVEHLTPAQRKKLAVLLGMMSHPSLLICEEPTSGLNATDSLEVCQHLKEVVGRGYTIIFTITHPRQEVFELLDEVFIMSDRKLTLRTPAALFGELAEELDIVSKQKTVTQDMFYLPGDPMGWVLDQLAYNKQEFLTQTLKYVDKKSTVDVAALTNFLPTMDFCDHYAASKYTKNKNEDEDFEPIEEPEDLGCCANFKAWSVRTWAQVWARLKVYRWRFLTNIPLFSLRDGGFPFLMAQLIVPSLLVGLLLWQQTTPHGQLIFFGLSTSIATVLMPDDVLLYHTEFMNPIYRFEKKLGLMDSISFLVSGLAKYSMSFAFYPIIFLVIMYNMGLGGDYTARSAICYLASQSVYLIINYLYLAILTLLIDDKVAVTKLMYLIVSFIVFFSGYIMPITILKFSWISFLFWINPMFWVFSIQAQAFYVGKQFPCDTANEFFCAENNGNAWLVQYGINKFTIYDAFFIECLFVILLLAIYFILFHWLQERKKDLVYNREFDPILEVANAVQFIDDEKRGDEESQNIEQMMMLKHRDLFEAVNQDPEALSRLEAGRDSNVTAASYFEMLIKQWFFTESMRFKPTSATKTMTRSRAISSQNEARRLREEEEEQRLNEEAKVAIDVVEEPAVEEDDYKDPEYADAPEIELQASPELEKRTSIRKIDELHAAFVEKASRFAEEPASNETEEAGPIPEIAEIVAAEKPVETEPEGFVETERKQDEFEEKFEGLQTADSGDEFEQKFEGLMQTADSEVSDEMDQAIENLYSEDAGNTNTAEVETLVTKGDPTQETAVAVENQSSDI